MLGVTLARQYWHGKLRIAQASFWTSWKKVYDNAELQDELGFSPADIQKARQTRAIADMARSIELPDEVRAKLENPRAKVFTTLARVFDSPIGRDFLKVEKDAEHGLKGTTDKTEFVRGFTKLVSDVALGKQSSRTLNKSDDIKSYFKKWDAKDLPKKKKGSFVPSDIIKGKSVASSSRKVAGATTKRSKQPSKSVLPRDFRVRFGSDRLIDIRRELVRLKREQFPNAGAVLLRAFFELSVLDYLDRSGELKELIAKLGGKANLPFGAPTLKQLVPIVLKTAKAKLGSAEANRVEKAIRYDAAAPFTVSDLHAFVHQASDPPSARDIWQFWLRTEPLFRLMLEQDLSKES